MEYILQNPQQLGSVVQGIRRARRLTQGAVGKRVGIRQSSVSGLEANPAPASLSQVFKLLSALDLELVIRDRSKSTGKSDW